MLARYYAPSLARFVSPDYSIRGTTTSVPQSWNKYVYALNNPLLMVDPDGYAPTLAESFAYLESRGLASGNWSDRAGRQIHRNLRTQSAVVSRNFGINRGLVVHGTTVVGIGVEDPGVDESTQANMQAVNMLWAIRASHKMEETNDPSVSQGQAAFSVLMDAGKFGSDMTGFATSALFRSASLGGVSPAVSLAAINAAAEQTGVRAKELSKDDIAKNEDLKDRNIGENDRVWKISDKDGKNNYVIARAKKR